MVKFFVLLASACSSSASFHDCAVRCASDNSCPDGFSCDVENRCRAQGATIACSALNLTDADAGLDASQNQDGPKLIDSQTTDGTTLHPLDLIQIASGSFMMGCNSAVDSECSANENPYHSVTLSAYSIERTEVTQASYQACITAGSCATPACDWMPATKASYPVTCVTWQDAANYCGWANARLPTEAEWERAARGTDGRKFPWGNAAPTCSLLNYASCNVGTVIVGSYSNGASPDGVLDMAGNVTEWVADWYSATYYGSSPSNDPTGPASSTGYRSSRGGSFGGAEISIRVSNRNGFNDPISALDYRGFRCAR